MIFAFPGNIERVMPVFKQPFRRVTEFLIVVGTSAWLVAPTASQANPGASAATANLSTIELTELKRRADEGSKRAQYNLSLRYASGDGVSQDPSRRIALLKASATSGYAPAQNSLGWIYREGLGRPKDPERAIRWFRLAALQGSALALENLGEMYEAGEGLDRDNTVAMAFFTLCASRDVEADRRVRDVEAGTTIAVLTCRVRLARRLTQLKADDKDVSSLAFAAAWIDMGLAQSSDAKDGSAIGTRAARVETDAKALMASIRLKLSEQGIEEEKRFIADWSHLTKDIVDATPHPQILSMTTDD